jgi:hypothetical protein
VPYDPREWLGVLPGVEAPLSIVDQLIALDDSETPVSAPKLVTKVL